MKMKQFNYFDQIIFTIFLFLLFLNETIDGNCEFSIKASDGHFHLNFQPLLEILDEMKEQEFSTNETGSFLRHFKYTWNPCNSILCGDFVSNDIAVCQRLERAGFAPFWLVVGLRSTMEPVLIDKNNILLKYTGLTMPPEPLGANQLLQDVNPIYMETQIILVCPDDHNNQTLSTLTIDDDNNNNNSSSSSSQTQLSSSSSSSTTTTTTTTTGRQQENVHKLKFTSKLICPLFYPNNNNWRPWLICLIVIASVSAGVFLISIFIVLYFYKTGRVLPIWSICKSDCFTNSASSYEQI